MHKIFISRYSGFLSTNASAATAGDCARLSGLDIAILGLLAAIWGASFIVMRVVVPELGSIFTADLRIVIAAIALLLFAYINQTPLDWRRNFNVYALAGLLGAVLPFSLFCYAAQYLPAAISALLNATCPLFGALFALLWRLENLTLRKLAGLVMGVAGLVLLLGSNASFDNCPKLLAILACLGAPACFALSAIVIKRHTCSKLTHNRITPLAMATGAMVAASALVLPSMPFLLPHHMPSLRTWVLVAALALIPSALAQILFIPLVAKIGPTRAMSVSFLIPLFSALWGFLFLQESIGIFSALGGLTVLTATGLILKT